MHGGAQRSRTGAGRARAAWVAAVVLLTTVAWVGSGGPAAAAPTQWTRITQPNSRGVETYACKTVVDTAYGPLYRVSVMATKTADREGFSQTEIRVPGTTQVVLNTSRRFEGFWGGVVVAYDLWAGSSPSNIVRAFPDEKVLDDRLDPFAARFARISQLAWCDGVARAELAGTGATQFSANLRNHTYIGLANNWGVQMYACKALVDVSGQRQYRLTVVATNPTEDPTAFSELSIQRPDGTGQPVTRGVTQRQWWGGTVQAYQVAAGTDPYNILDPFPDSNYAATAENPTHHRFPRVWQVSSC